MSEGTTIEWATHTWNPWEGCTKVSPGCANCYAEARNRRFSAGANWGKGKPRRRTASANWRKPEKWNREAGLWAERTQGAGVSTGLRDAARPRVFPSLCDWLDTEVPMEWLADFLRLLHDTPNLDWLLLTKRPENWRMRLNEYCASRGSQWSNAETAMSRWLFNNAPANVWIGTSVEDQKRADERIPALLKIPAAVRFLSVEPLLGPVQLGLGRYSPGAVCKLHCVIVGGESGPGARPCRVEWVRDIVGQCEEAQMPCFVKQLGAFVVHKDGSQRKRWLLDHPKGGDPAEWPEDLRVRQFPNNQDQTT